MSWGSLLSEGLKGRAIAFAAYIGTGIVIAKWTEYKTYRLLNDGKHEIDFTVIPPGKLIFTSLQAQRESQGRSGKKDPRILSNSESSRLVRDMPLPELVKRLQMLGWRTLSEDAFKMPNTPTYMWLNTFREQELDFGTLYAWASRYMLEDGVVANTPQDTGSSIQPPIKILQLTDPLAFNQALTQINSDTEPYARYIQAGGFDPNSRSGCTSKGGKDPGKPPKHLLKQWILHPLRIFPRRIWDLYSNRVIPFDWLVNVKHQKALESDINTTSDPVAWGWRTRLMEYPSVTAAGFDIVPFAAISHSWTGDENMIPVWTEINRYQWPVPFPKDASLDNLRTELLDMGLRYCWVDVLCLRQSYNPDLHWGSLQKEIKIQSKDRAKATRSWDWWFKYMWGDEQHQWLIKLEQDLRYSEDIRKREWKIDVPTIGNIYQRAQHIVIYLNGLGRPLEWNWEQDLKQNTRHWLRRAWTLQELGGKGRAEKYASLGGVERATWDGKAFKTKVGEVPRAAELEKSLAALKDKVSTGGISVLVEEMNKRESTNELDKIAGIVYLMLESDYSSIPVYDESEDTTTAWIRCIQMLVSQHGLTRGVSWSTWDLLKSFPHPSSQHWYPSWQQLSRYPDVSLREPLIATSRDPETELRLFQVGKAIHRISMLRGCKIKLIESEGNGDKQDKWEYTVTWDGWFRTKGTKSTEYIKLRLDKKTFVEPIPDGEYTLIGIWEKGIGRTKQRVRKCKVIVCTEEKQEGIFSDLLWNIYLRKVAVVDASYAVPYRGKYGKRWFGPGIRQTWKRVTLL